MPRATCGADHVIDYNGKDFLADLDRFDVIFDAVGKSSFVNCGPLLAPGGTYVTTLPKASLFFWGGSNRLPEFSVRRNAQREF